MIRKGTVRPSLPKILTDSNGATTLHGGDGGELRFHLLKSVKRQNGPLGHSVSTNFVANCSFLILKPLPFVCAAGDSKLAPRSKKNFP